MTMRGAVYVNGTITSADTAVIPVFDHGFVYGEGVYEVLRTYSGVPFLYDRHITRLRNSARYLHLDVPFDDETLRSWVDKTADAAALAGDTYIRILLTRGIGELTYDVRATPAPSVVIIIKPQEGVPARVRSDGIRISLVPILRNHPGSVNPMIKSNNLMNSALAMQEAFRSGAFEGVMRNYRGEIAECTTSNLFVIKNGEALTPPLDAGLLPGITREFVFDIGADRGIPVREAVLRDNDLFAADEAFLTSTTREIVPIVTVNDRRISSGTPGAVTRALMDAFRQKARELSQANRLELKR